MTHTMSHSLRNRAALTASLLSLLVLGACGTPASVTPPKNPLPGLTNDVQSARHVAKELQAEHNAAIGATP